MADLEDCPRPLDFVNTALWLGQGLCPHNGTERLDLAGDSSEASSPEVSIHRERLWVLGPSPPGAPPRMVSSNIGDQGVGKGKMKNRPNSGPKTETKLNVFSVRCLSLPFQKWSRKN